VDEREEERERGEASGKYTTGLDTRTEKLCERDKCGPAIIVNS
jgi:hypothetical protein